MIQLLCMQPIPNNKFIKDSDAGDFHRSSFVSRPKPPRLANTLIFHSLIGSHFYFP